ncbi:MAG: right-handed parallel beta-helix repeat-containing protein, partial [Candidatus Eisenbacteria bacterium]|nr:right-handed parallel beta-helix repeat-containing protein [Candidatus Eisenbacteria bacterium]
KEELPMKLKIQMKTCVLFVLLTLALSAGSAAAGTIIVDPAGGGDFDNIPEAVFHGTADDTVLVLPGFYEVETGIPYPWPILLDADSPVLVSQGGAALTLIFGGGLMPAFEVPDGTFGARAFIAGFKFQWLETPLDWGYPTSGTVHFTDNIVEGCQTGVDVRMGQGLVARNVIEGPGICGIEAGHFEGVVEDNEVHGFKDGVTGTDGNTVIQRNHIHDNGITGVGGFDNCIAIDNVVENNGWAGFSISFDAHLMGNVIRGNGTGVEFWGGPHNGFLNGNDIYDNVEFAVRSYCEEHIPYPPDFDATMNWWGTTDPDAIAAGIWDCHDSIWAAVCFVVEPWCTTPGCDATPAAAASWGAIKAMYR